MQPLTLVTLGFSSACQGCAVWFAWKWYVPVLQRISHRPVAARLLRAGQIGFNERILRERLFMTEAVLLAGLVCASWHTLGLVLGITILAICYHLRGLLLAWTIDAREQLLRAQTLELTTGLDGLVRGGLGLAQAIEMLAAETPAPLGKLIARIASDFRGGRPLSEAMHAVRHNLRLDAFSLLITSVQCALKQGSSLEASLAGVQEALEHRSQVERQLRAKTSAARSTIALLSCMPLAFLAIFGFMMPGSMSILFSTELGKLLVACILSMMYLGIVWAKHLLTIK